MKKGFLKRLLLGVVRSPVVRGLVKSLPFGNVAYEVGENIIGATVQQSKDGALDNANATSGKPHSAISLICQIAVLGLIVWAFITKQITIEEVLNLLGITADDFKSYQESAPQVINVIQDTLK